MFNVNEAFDHTAFKPLAMLYDTVMPDFAQTIVTNFFGNINDVWYAFNNLLQGQGEKGMTDVARVMVNSVFGLGGVIDVAIESQYAEISCRFRPDSRCMGYGSRSLRCFASHWTIYLA